MTTAPASPIFQTDRREILITLVFHYISPALRLVKGDANEDDQVQAILGANHRDDDVAVLH